MSDAVEDDDLDDLDESATQAARAAQASAEREAQQALLKELLAFTDAPHEDPRAVVAALLRAPRPVPHTPLDLAAEAVRAERTRIVLRLRAKAALIDTGLEVLGWYKGDTIEARLRRWASVSEAASLRSEAKSLAASLL